MSTIKNRASFPGKGAMAFFLLFALLAFGPAAAQQQTVTTTVTGQLIEKGTRIPVPFADVIFVGTTTGTVTDTIGKFSMSTTKKVSEIKVSFLGYKPVKLPINYGETQDLVIEMEQDGFTLSQVEIKYTGNPAEKLIDSARAHRGQNDPNRFGSLQYEAYVKTQFNLYNLTEKFKNQKIFKPFHFIFENPDTVKGVPHYPFLLSETISDIYKKTAKEPLEVLKAVQISGIENENFGQLLGSVYNEFNIYNDNQMIFGKTFMGPLSPIALTYYRVYLVDSAFIDKDWCYKIELKPKISGELVYNGFIWIHDSTYAIKRVDIAMNKKANINLVADFTLYEEFEHLGDSVWVLRKEKARLDVNPRDFISFSMNLAPKSEKFRMSIFKTSSFKDFQVNKPPGPLFPKIGEDITVLEDVKKDSAYWIQYRHDTLTAQEDSIYQKVNRVKQHPLFKFLYKVGDLIGSGYVNLDYVGIGPIYEVWSMNDVEGHRIKIGGRTGDKVSKRLLVEGHVMYGTKDDRWKWDLWATWHFNKRKNPWRMIGVRARMDIEQIGLSNNQWRPDNFLGSFLRRRSLSDLSYINQIQVYYDHDWFTGFNQKLSFEWLEMYETGPDASLRFGLLDQNGNVTQYLNKFTKTEIKLETTFAYGQKMLQGRNKRRFLRGKFPVLKLTYAFSIKGFLGSDYTYHNLKLSVSDRVRIKPLGFGDYEIAGGRVFGTVPYPLMEIHSGNDTYMYDQFAFNLMNYFEFVSDYWVSFRYEHHFEGFFFNKIPGISKLKWREVIGVRGVWGGISDYNRRYMALPENTSELVDKVSGKHIPYIEMNVGIENIFNILRVDFLYRFTHRRGPDPNTPGQELYRESVNWGIMGGISLRL